MIRLRRTCGLFVRQSGSKRQILSVMKTDARIALLILAAVWAGIVIGVSLIATPAKFQAPSLTMQAGLEVGRYTFRMLGRVELCFLILTIAAATLARPGRVTTVILTLIVAIVALQRLWLLPYLDSRVSDIIAGAAPTFSIQHVIYTGMEIGKATLLIACAVIGFRSELS